MWKKVLTVIGAVSLACGLAIIIINSTVSADGKNPPTILVPIPQEPDSIDPSGVQIVFLEPIHPDELKTNQVLDQGENVNGLVQGPGDANEYRCVVYLEPIKPGESASKTSRTVCNSGMIDAIDDISLESSYLIAKYDNWTGYTWLLVEYYGRSPCSESISYGVSALPDNLDNKFASGEAYSDCDHIQVYDFNGYSGPSYSCGASCSSFYALNDHVSSWRVGD